MLVSKGWQVEQDTLRKGNLRFLLASDLSAIYEVFERKVYYVDVRGSTVVDVGAGTGDSCLYFAMLGARKVIGVEPEPSRFALAKRNLHLNPELAYRIELKMGYVRSPGPSTVKSFTLSQLVASIGHPLVLKMDCEGCEYNFILNADDKILAMFDQIFIEYHYGGDFLVRKLKRAGFKVNKSWPIRGYNEFMGKNIYVGYVMANRYYSV